MDKWVPTFYTYFDESNEQTHSLEQPNLSHQNIISIQHIDII